MEWLKLLISVSIVFVFSVIGVMLIKKCSIKNATIVCREFVKEILGALFAPTPKPKQYYPTIAGWDGNRIVPKLVDADFHSVCENFISCFCTYCGFLESEDVVIYQFDILRKPDSHEDEILEKIIQKQSEEVVTNTMRIYDFYLPPEPLTLIELFSTKLCVAFARSEEGIKKLDEEKRKIQRRKVMANHTNQGSMTETWGQ